MTVQQVAKQLEISASLVYELCHAGVIACTRHGRPGKRGTIRIAEEAVQAYLASCKGEARPRAGPALNLRHVKLQPLA